MVAADLRPAGRTRSRSPRAGRATRRGPSATGSSTPSFRPAARSPGSTRTAADRPRDDRGRVRARCASASGSTTTTRRSCSASSATRLSARASGGCAGLRPVRLGTVAQALLRALCGQLILASEARAMERRIIRATTEARREWRHAPPTVADLARLLARRATASSACTRDAAPRSPASARWELERLKEQPTAVVADRLNASAASARGRSGSSASKGSAASSGGSRETSAS